MAIGRPVISTYIAGIPELVEPGRSGWLVPAGAVGPLVDAMAEALTADPAELDRMGRAGAARVAEQHDIGTEVRKLAAFFMNSCGIAGRSRPVVPSPHATAVHQSPAEPRPGFAPHTTFRSLRTAV